MLCCGFSRCYCLVLPDGALHHIGSVPVSPISKYKLALKFAWLLWDPGLPNPPENSPDWLEKPNMNEHVFFGASRWSPNGSHICIGFTKFSYQELPAMNKLVPPNPGWPKWPTQPTIPTWIIEWPLFWRRWSNNANPKWPLLKKWLCSSSHHLTSWLDL